MIIWLASWMEYNKARGCGTPMAVTREKSVAAAAEELTNSEGKSAGQAQIESARVLLKSARLDKLNSI